MSADDFQNKYASVMESMLKSAIAETTKLFETMVDELKAEISQIKKENEDLKSRCIQYETTKSQLLKQTRDRSHDLEQNDASQKCDTAVQCDLGPCRTVLVEQCPPLGLSELRSQGQQYDNVRMNYSLLEHNYVSKGEPNSKTALVAVKQEEWCSDSSLQCVVKQEEIESSVASGQVMSCDQGSKDQECSSEEIKSTQRKEATQVVLGQPTLGIDRSLKHDQNQSHNPQNSLVISLKDAFKSYFKEECEVAQRMTETAMQEEPTSKTHLDPQESHPDSITLVSKQSGDDVQCAQKALAESQPVDKEVASEELKEVVTKTEVCPKPNLTAPRRRGRPPKKKRKQNISQSTEVPKGQKSTNDPLVKEKGIELLPVMTTEKVSPSKSLEQSSPEPTETLFNTTPLVHRSQDQVLEDERKVDSSVSVESLSSRGSSDKQTPSESQPLSKEEKEHSYSTFKTHLDPQESHPDSLTLVSKQNGDDLQCAQKALAESQPVDKEVASEELKEVVTQTEVGPKPNLTPPRRRGRPPKKKRKQNISQSTEVPKGQKSTNDPLVKEKGIELLPVMTTEKVSSSKSLEQSSPEPTETLFNTTPLVHRSQDQVLEDKKRKVDSSVSVESLSSRASSDKQTPSESQLLLKKGKENATATKTFGDSAACETHSTQQAGSSQTSCQLKEPYSSASLQDAMLLIEAMNRSTSRVSQPQSTNPQTQGASDVGTLGMVNKNRTLPQTNSVQTQLTSTSLNSPSPITYTSSTGEVQTSNSIHKPDQQNIINLPSTTPSIKSSPDATQTAKQLLPGLLLRLRAPSKTPRTIIVVPKPGQPLNFPNAGPPLSQSPNVETTAEGLLSRPTALYSPVGTPSVYSVPQKQNNITCNKLSSVLPVQATTNQTDKRPQQEISITPRQVKTETMRKPGIIILRTKCDSSLSAAPASLDPSIQVISTPQKLSPTHLDETTLSEKISDRTENLDYTKPATPVCETSNSLKATRANSETSNELQLTSAPSVLAPAAEPKHFPVVRLIRLPFPISTQESISVSRLFPDRFSEGSSQKPFKSADMSVLTPVKTAHVPDEPKGPSILEETPAGRDVQPEPVVEMSDAVNNMMDLSPVPGTAAEVTSNLSKVLKNEGQRNQSSGRLQLTPISTKDPSYPQLQMTKTQFLAQLSVSPIVQEEMTNAYSSADSKETGTRGKKCQQKASIVTRLRSHLKNCLKARTTGMKMEPNPQSPKKPRLEKDDINDKNKTETICNRKPDEMDNSTSTNRVETHSLISPGGSSNCENVITTTRRVEQPVSVSCRSESPSDSSVQSFEKLSSSEAGVDPNSTASTPVRPQQSTDASPNMSSNAVGSIFKKDNSLNPYRSIKHLSIVGGIRSKTESDTSLGVRGHQMTRTSVSPERSGESTSANKPKLTECRPATKARFKVANATRLTQAAKANRRGKMKRSGKSKRQKKLGENQANNGVVKKCRAQVWYPPTLPPNEVPSTERRKPPPVVVEDKIPPIPFNQAPIVSPLQPLAVIGKHLLRNQCGQCGRVFSSNAALESHVSLHAGYRLYSCSLCGKCFPDSKTFKRHHRVHRNGRIHICRHCGKGFVYRFGLSKHLQMVHSRIKPFICQVCNKGFFTKRDVEVHIRIHTGEKPFQCHLCEKKFTRRVELNVHLRWHNGEKRYWCPYCGKGFLDLNNLKRHKYTHTGEKPHSCPRCPKRFTQGAHLKKHLRNVHKEN